MICIRCVLPFVLLGVCKSESVHQFNKYLKLDTSVSQNISAITKVKSVVECDQYYSNRTTRVIAYDATLQLCHLYEENAFPVMLLPSRSAPWTLYVKGKFYGLIHTKMTWNDARLNCEVSGGQLVKIESAEENELVMSWLGSYGRHPDPSSDLGQWIGLSDQATEGLFVWTDDSSLGNFSRWSPGNPDNYNNIEHCVEIGFQSLWWNDAPCSSAVWSICEFY